MHRIPTRWRTPLSLVVLALSSAALIATQPPRWRVEARNTNGADIVAGQTLRRRVEVSLTPAGVAAVQALSPPMATFQLRAEVSGALANAQGPAPVGVRVLPDPLLRSATAPGSSVYVERTIECRTERCALTADLEFFFRDTVTAGTVARARWTLTGIATVRGSGTPTGAAAVVREIALP